MSTESTDDNQTPQVPERTPPTERPGESQAPVLSAEARAAALSGFRIKATFGAMVVAIILGLAALIFGLVTNIFDTLTPSLERDLTWKAERGATELSRTTDLGIAAEDRDTIAKGCKDYLEDSDVLAIVVADPDGKRLFSHGVMPVADAIAFSGPPAHAKRGKEHLTAWAPAEIEGMTFGKVALAVSTKRLESGLRLRREILLVGFAGALVALLGALAFVSLHVSPLLRMTEDAFHQLERTTEVALESARLKSQFLANMSHEIRTPMNGVLGMTRLILDLPLEPKLRRYVETVDASGRALLTIINDVLDFSRVEAGRYNLQELPYDLRGVTQEVIELLAERAHDKRIELGYRIAPTVPSRVVGDPDRFRQVLTNLLGNAIKFTQEGEVFVELSATQGDSDTTLKVSVSDTGVGIAEEARERVFEAFSQQDGSIARAYGGTGLGLAISKRLVEAMGGEITLESKEDLGSCFHFTMPLKEIEAEAEELLPIEPRGRRALVVDASDRSREVLAEHLASWDVECTALAGSEGALDELRRAHTAGTPYDVVVVSARVKDRTGEGLIASIRDVPELRSLPVIFLARLGVGATPVEISEAVAHVLSKPIRMSDLYDCLVELFSGGSRRARKRSSAQATILPSGAPRGTILIVDDNEINRFVAAEQVRQFGYQAGQANNGEEAITEALSGRYSAVLMDCQMPVMDGYQATREIRKRERDGVRLPIIALTAHAMIGERDKVLAAGMDDCLTKPLRADLLRKSLARYVTKQRKATASTHVESQQTRPAGASNLATGPRRSPRLVELFLDLIPKQLEELREAAAAGDADRFRALAHKLKGGCLSFGAKRMAPIASDLQHIRDEDLCEAVERVNELEALFGLLEEELGAQDGGEERPNASDVQPQPAAASPSEPPPPCS